MTPGLLIESKLFIKGGPVTYTNCLHSQCLFSIVRSMTVWVTVVKPRIASAHKEKMNEPTTNAGGLEYLMLRTQEKQC